MNSFVELLGLSLFGVSVACAGPQMSETPIELSAQQMDTVTAGFGSFVDAGAVGISEFFASTQTDVIAIATITTTEQPLLGAVVGISGGEAQAVAVGDGSDTATVVSPTNNITGSNTYTFELNVHMKGEIVEVSGAGLTTIGNVLNNPL